MKKEGGPWLKSQLNINNKKMWSQFQKSKDDSKSKSEFSLLVLPFPFMMDR